MPFVGTILRALGKLARGVGKTAKSIGRKAGQTAVDKTAQKAAGTIERTAATAKRVSNTVQEARKYAKGESTVRNVVKEATTKKQPRRKKLKSLLQSDKKNEQKTERRKDAFKRSQAVTIGKGSDADLFYGLNSKITKGVEKNMRDKVIMDYYGVTNLEDAYRETMKRYERELREAEEYAKTNTEDFPEDYSEASIKYDRAMAAALSR